MKTKDEAIKFLKYVHKQLKSFHKPDNFNQQDYLNKVLLANWGYENYFIVIDEDKPTSENVALCSYSDLDEWTKAREQNAEGEKENE